MYRYFSLPYDSPTVGLYFFSEDYMRFLSNLKYYLAQELFFIPIEKSRYKEELERRGMTSPIGVLGDVEINFLHYKTEEEARIKWVRRSQRIHWDALFVKFSETNFCNRTLLEKFDSLDYKHKIVFTTRDYRLASQIIFKDYIGCEEVRNDTLHFRKYINLIKWINGDDNYFRRQ